MVNRELEEEPTARLSAVLKALGVAKSSWYHVGVTPEERKRPGPPAKLIPDEVMIAVVNMAVKNPWYGYKRIAVMCRREGVAVKNRQAYLVMRDHGLLKKKRHSRKAELYQTSKLYELLPDKPNDLWQMDVTYVHIPGYGWYYAVTVMDYYSRYLLACHLTSSYSATEVLHGLKLARQETERIGGPLEEMPFLVTDNGSSFIARRFGEYVRDQFTHVRIQYRTATQLGLLERFHNTLKDEEVYWRLYDNPAHARECLAEFQTRYNTRRPHWALVPEGGGDPWTPEEVYVQDHATRIPKWQGWAKGAKAKLDELIEKAA